MEASNPLFDHAVPGSVQSHPRVAVALHVIQVLLDTEQGSETMSMEGVSREGGRELTSEEKQLKKSATGLLTQYLNGEAMLDSLQLYPNVAEQNLQQNIAMARSQQQPVVVRRRRRRGR